MRYFIAIVVGGLFLASCKKDKYTTAPQITYKSIQNNVQNSSTPVSDGANAKIIFSVTDGEGDLGLKSGKDTAYIFIKSLLTNDVDSVLFPDLSSVSKKDFKATVTFGLTNNVLKCRPVPGNLTHVDTIYYEVYVRDFAKNKSNVIRTGDPVFYTCQ
jgi:hypothetical protein